LFAFGIGTLPLLLSFGFLTSLISRQASGRILRASGLIVLGLGLIMLNRGLILTGSGYDAESLAQRAKWQTLIVQEHQTAPAKTAGLQILRTEVTEEGFEPANFSLRKGIPVRWIINAKELTECNRTILIPKLGLQIDLHPGEQTIEFTPPQTGAILWSCWMGMQRGEFQVEDDETSKLSPETPPDFIGPPLPK
jgi:hypothetical protein